MENQVKISYVVPVYNGELVLAHAVDSILHGAIIGSVEVIIVENGSTDRTNEVAEELCARYNQAANPEAGEKLELVRLYHSEKGVSNARNLGIEKARGKWIAFLDADDQITSDGIHLMILDSMTSKADMIVYSHMAGADKRGVVNGPVEYFVYDEKHVQSLRVRMISNPTRYMQAWAKLFRLETMLRHHVRFDATMSLSEDSDFVLRFTRYCRQIDFSSGVVYRYSVDLPSTIRSYDGTKAERFADALKRTGDAIQGEAPAIRRAFRQYVLMNMNVVMVREVWEKSNPHSEAEKLAEQKRVTKMPIFAKTLRRTRLTQCRNARMIPILCLKLHFYKLASLIYKKRSNDNAKLSERSAQQ